MFKRHSGASVLTFRKFSTDKPPSDGSKDQPHRQSVADKAAEGAQSVGAAYEDLELRVMARIGNQNRDRFRLLLASSIVFVVWVIAVFGSRIRKSLGSQAIEVAQEMAENEQLKVQSMTVRTLRRQHL